ncbi:hypothetical protein X975_10415, partial [Stegodyphus mimosarum]
MSFSLQCWVCYMADGDAFLQHKVAGYETWCHHFQSEVKSISTQWKHPDSPRPQKFRTEYSAGKVMLTAFSTFRVPCYWSLRSHTSPSMP